LLILSLVLFAVIASTFIEGCEGKAKKGGKSKLTKEEEEAKRLKLEEEKEERRKLRQLERDVAWHYSDNAYERCLNSGCHKLSCSRFHQAVEDVFNDVGGTYAQALNRTGAEIIRFMVGGHNKWQWNMIVHQMIKWMKDNRVFDARLIREALDKQFSNFYLKLVVNDQQMNDSMFTDDMDPELIERRLWRKSEKERKIKEAEWKGEEPPVFPDDDDQASQPEPETETESETETEENLADDEEVEMESQDAQPTDLNEATPVEHHEEL